MQYNKTMHVHAPVALFMSCLLCSLDPEFPDAKELLSVRILSSSRRNFTKNIAVLAFTRKERMNSNVKGVKG